MVQVVIQAEEGPELKKLVDEDIDKFEEWFRSLPNDPLTKSERAIISTYLWWKVKGNADGSQASR
jgi:hypothetical protein